MTATKKTYIEAIGRRKTASARVRITKAKENRVLVNDRALADYFYASTLQKNVLNVFETPDAGIDTYEVTA